MEKTTVLAERERTLRMSRGWESSKSLCALRAAGGSANDAFLKVYGYGRERWSLLHDAGYPVKEVYAVIMNGWAGAPDPIINPDSRFRDEFRQNRWEKLYWGGYNIDELKTVGFAGALSALEMQTLKSARTRHRTGRLFG